MCLYPTLIKNKKYIANKKNGGNIPAVSDNRVLYVPVACGKCMECKKKKSRDWQVRLLEDSKHIKNGKFVTFTFSNESIIELHKSLPVYTNKNNKKLKLEGYERDNAIAKLGVRRFLEKWRKKHKKSVRHWLITELGHEGTENIHLHGIIWTEHEEDIDKIWDYREGLFKQIKDLIPAKMSSAVGKIHTENILRRTKVKLIDKEVAEYSNPKEKEIDISNIYHTNTTQNSFISDKGTKMDDMMNIPKQIVDIKPESNILLTDIYRTNDELLNNQTAGITVVS